MYASKLEHADPETAVGSGTALHVYVKYNRPIATVQNEVPGL